MENGAGERRELKVVMSEKDAVLFEAGLIGMVLNKFRRSEIYQKRRWFRRIRVERLIEFRDAVVLNSTRLPDGGIEMDVEATPVIIEEKQV